MNTRFALLLLLFFLPPKHILASDSLELLKSKDHFAMIRHANAPGTGDPLNFKIGDCKTQRNLSEAGKSQAEAIGKKLRSKIGAEFFVYTSQWCRCKDTAKLLGGRPAIELPVLNSFFQNPAVSSQQTRELKVWLKDNLSKQVPLVLVTHQVNITELTGVFPSEGEILILKMNENGKITRVK